jgi:copper(I)-binding protein
MLRPSFLAAAFVLSAAWSAAAQSSGVAVTDAWARATPPGAKAAAAYVTIANNGSAADQLVAASTPVAGKAQVHTTINADGVMQMRPVDALDVKPGATVTLKPGGYHIMLTDLKQPLKEGDTFPLSLRFQTAGTIETTVAVAKAGAMSGMDMKSMPDMNMK